MNLCLEIARGAYKQEDTLPDPDTLALDLILNPRAVFAAYETLLREDILQHSGEKKILLPADKLEKIPVFQDDPSFSEVYSFHGFCPSGKGFVYKHRDTYYLLNVSTAHKKLRKQLHELFIAQKVMPIKLSGSIMKQS